jgi:hypothetical protein
MQNIMTKKVQLVLTDEALAVIDDHAPGERKRGDWVSAALIDYARITAGISPLGNDDDGLLERIDSRLARIEKQVGLLIAERSK